MTDKTQNVRVIDVLVIGPTLVYAATFQLPQLLRIALAVFGYATIVYNARNYARNDPTSEIMRVIGSLPLPDG